MAFMFALSAVLTVRRQREEAAERTLARALGELQEARRTLEWVRREVLQAAEERNGASPGRVEAVVLQERYARVVLLEAARTETEVRVAAAEGRVATEQAAYLGARRERELLEEMEDRQRSFHAVELLRREARRTDDLMLGRRVRQAEMAAREANS